MGLNEQTNPSDGAAKALFKRPWFLATLAVIAAILVFTMAMSAMGGGSLMGGGSHATQPLVPYTVKRSDLPVDITVSGNLESQDNTEIICEVDDIHGDNIWGTPVIWVVPNGSSVKKDDLLIEMDMSSHQERLDEQILDTEEARSRMIQAEVKHSNRIAQNATALAEAELAVELANLALDQYFDTNGGTHQINLQALDLQIREAQAGQLIEQTNLAGVEQLYKLGYRSSGELAQARLSALRAERQLANALAQKKELEIYTWKKNDMTLKGKVASAKRLKDQVEQDNVALLKQAKAAMDAAVESFKKEKERLDRYQEQISKSKIRAPHDGMVAYVVSHYRGQRLELRVGAAIRPMQHVISLPGLTRMMVKTNIHESVLDQVKTGLSASIRVDAFPEKRYQGKVKTVAVLPDQNHWMSSDTKVYETVVTIDEEVERLKPGMTAVVEIHVDYLTDVLSVPVQAVVQIDEETWCYIIQNGRPVRRDVKLGLSNDKFVEIKSGLNEGDSVALNTMAVVDERQARRKTVSPDAAIDKEKARKRAEQNQALEVKGPVIPGELGESGEPSGRSARSDERSGGGPEKRSGGRSERPKEQR